jgi:hypothetical protein
MNKCGCITCYEARTGGARSFFTLDSGFRYACEICGNKRCPHHTNHELRCTGSNESGQKGSVYE